MHHIPFKNADTLETLTRQLWPFKLSCSHGYVAELAEKGMVEWMSEGMSEGDWICF